MVKETKQRIVFIGAGNLATHLSMALQQAGYDVAQVYSRTEDSAQRLAGKLKCGMTTRIEELYNDADIYIFSVSDSALEKLIDKVPRCEEALYLHTAGSIPMSVFSGKCRRYGVLYPLQTFSKNRDVQFDEIPVFIEGSSPETTATLQKIGREISGQVLEATSETTQTSTFGCRICLQLHQPSLRHRRRTARKTTSAFRCTPPAHTRNGGKNRISYAYRCANRPGYTIRP